MRRVLFIVPLPPPVHGSSMISQYIRESRIINGEYDCDYVNLSTSRSVEEIGSNSFSKLHRFLSSFFLSVWLLVRHRYSVCFISPTCHGKGFLKDFPFIFVCKLFCKKVILHHENKGLSEDVDKWPYCWLMPYAYRNAKVILLSWLLYPDVERVVKRNQVLICPNAIPDIQYCYQDKNNPIPNILFLSNLIVSKGVVVLLDALKILKEQGIVFYCDFVGSETNEITAKRFKEESTIRGLNNYVIFHGPKFRNEKSYFFENADIFVFPTYYHNETFGLVNLEAMAYGLPIITTDEGGIPDVVKDGENGLICKQRDAISLANCIKILIKDKDLRARMGLDGMKKYQEKYTISVFEKRIKDILESC